MVAGEKQYFFITVKLDYNKISYNELPFIKNKKNLVCSTFVFSGDNLQNPGYNEQTT